MHKVWSIIHLHHLSFLTSWHSLWSKCFWIYSWLMDHMFLFNAKSFFIPPLWWCFLLQTHSFTSAPPLNYIQQGNACLPNVQTFPSVENLIWNLPIFLMLLFCFLLRLITFQSISSFNDLPHIDLCYDLVK